MSRNHAGMGEDVPDPSVLLTQNTSTLFLDEDGEEVMGGTSEYEGEPLEHSPTLAALEADSSFLSLPMARHPCYHSPLSSFSVREAEECRKTPGTVHRETTSHRDSMSTPLRGTRGTRCAPRNPNVLFESNGWCDPYRVPERRARRRQEEWNPEEEMAEVEGVPNMYAANAASPTSVPVAPDAPPRWMEREGLPPCPAEEWEGHGMRCPHRAPPLHDPHEKTGRNRTSERIRLHPTRRRETENLGKTTEGDATGDGVEMDMEWPPFAPGNAILSAYASSWREFGEGNDEDVHEEDEVEEAEEAWRGRDHLLRTTPELWMRRDPLSVPPLPPPRLRSPLFLSKEEVWRYFPHLRDALPVSTTPLSPSSTCGTISPTLRPCVQYRVMYGRIGRIKKEGIAAEDSQGTHPPQQDLQSVGDGGPLLLPTTVADSIPTASRFCFSVVEEPSAGFSSCSRASSRSGETSIPFFPLESEEEVLDLRYLSSVFRHAEYHHPAISAALSPSLMIDLAPGVKTIPSPIIRLQASGKFSIFRIRTEEEGQQAAEHFLRLLHLCPPPPPALPSPSLSLGFSSSTRTMKRARSPTASTIRVPSGGLQTEYRYGLRYLRTSTVTAVFHVQRPIRLYEVVGAFRVGQQVPEPMNGKIMEHEEEGGRGKTARLTLDSGGAVLSPYGSGVPMEDDHRGADCRTAAPVMHYDGWADGDPSSACCHFTIRLREEETKRERDGKRIVHAFTTHHASSPDLIHCMVHVSGRLRFTGRNEAFVNKAFDCLVPWVASHLAG